MFRWTDCLIIGYRIPYCRIYKPIIDFFHSRVICHAKSHISRRYECPFLISCERQGMILLSGSSAVAGDPKKRTGIILAANYEARACGSRPPWLFMKLAALP